MPSCREIDPLFAPYIDGEATPDQRAIVDAHLKACPKCRHHTALQTAVRTTVREKLSRPCAPDALRERCRAVAHIGSGPFGLPISRLKSLAVAAALVLLVGGVLMYGLVGVPTVLAAQLTFDHIACFALRGADTPVDIRTSEEQYARDYGQAVRLPRAVVPGLQLVGLRQCYCGEGAAAHAMYRLDGRPLSLYVIPDAQRDPASTAAFGHDAVIWSRGTTTYVLVGNEPREALERVAEQMDKAL